MAGFFYNLGRMIGPRWRRGRWMWESATGSEADVIAAEHRVGRDMHESLAGQLGVSEDAAARELVERIGASLAACVRNKHRRFQFTVARSGEPNAFALPGGFIFITSSLLELVGRSADQVAFVLGHEIGHVVKQHPAERVFSDAALGAAARALPAAGGAAGQWARSSVLQLMQSAYSQDRELLADRLGVRVAMAAGFDPQGAIGMLAKLQELQAGRPQLPLAEYFASHPPLELRIAQLRQHLSHRNLPR